MSSWTYWNIYHLRYLPQELLETKTEIKWKWTFLLFKCCKKWSEANVSETWECLHDPDIYPSGCVLLTLKPCHQDLAKTCRQWLIEMCLWRSSKEIKVLLLEIFLKWSKYNLASLVTLDFRGESVIIFWAKEPRTSRTWPWVCCWGSIMRIYMLTAIQPGITDRE